MPRSLAATTSLDTIRKEARRWLNALRTGDAAALQRFVAAGPKREVEPSLRRVQHALAREYGFADWAALKADRTARVAGRQDRSAVVATFLENACLHYGVRPDTGEWNPGEYPDGPARWAYAASLLDRHPELAANSIHTAVACGDLDEVRRILAAQPAAASEKGGPEGWEPLLRLAYNRLPTAPAADTAVAIAELLLAAGANANARWGGDGDYGFTVLTGLIGSGEGPRAIHPPHPAARPLAELLVASGADPYDRQSLYNLALHGDDVDWFEFIYTHGTRSGQPPAWLEIDWLLQRAVISNHPQRVDWLLAHGAQAAKPVYGKPSLYEEAMVRGLTDVAATLLRHGAAQTPLSGEAAFQAACMRLDRAAAQALLDRHPEFRDSPVTMILATEQDRADVVLLLLELGLSPDVSDQRQVRPLHVAAAHGAERVAQLLLAHGAAVDSRDGQFNAPPLGWAAYFRKPTMIALLGRLSSDVMALTRTGQVERLRQLCAANPALAQSVNDGETLWFALPDDEAQAVEIAEVLLDAGADPTLPNAEGATVRELAAARGFDDLVDLLDSARHR